VLSNLKNISDRLNQREAEQEFKLKMIDVHLLIPCARNLYGIRDIDELAEDIKENGLYHNLVVRPVGNDMYEILSGERRYKALEKLGYKKIPCQVREDLESKDLDAEILLIQANAKARELTHVEKMHQIKRLEELYKEKRGSGEKLQGKTRDIIGKDVGLSGAQVGRYQKIEKNLIGGLVELLDKDKITLTQADILASLDNTEQAIMYDQIKNLGKEETKVIVEGIKQSVDLPKDKVAAEEFIKEKGARDEHLKEDKNINAQEVKNLGSKEVTKLNSKEVMNVKREEVKKETFKEADEEPEELTLEQVIKKHKVNLFDYRTDDYNMMMRIGNVKDFKIEDSGDMKQITVISNEGTVMYVKVKSTECIRKSEFMYELKEVKGSVGVSMK
jgi:ParB family chromosome partitioning protein